MPMFKFNVTEIRSYDCVYTVEADSLEEAYEMALIGDTQGEEETRLNGVVDRQVES